MRETDHGAVPNHRNTRAKIGWRCRLGSRELELMLLNYLEQHYPHSSAAAQAAFQRLLQLPEDVLQRCLLGQDSPQNTELAELVDQIRTAFNAGA